MKIIILAKALSPLALPKDRSVSTNYLGTNDYITGTQFRGALADLYLREIGDDTDEIFRKIFIEEKASFSFLYPLNAHSIVDNEKLIEIFSSVGPIPLTAKSCKKYPGFAQNVEEHGVVDLLLSMLESTEKANELKEKDFCKVCKQQNEEQIMDSFRGFMVHDQQDAYYKVTVAKQMITRTAINNFTGIAKEGMLYSFETVREGQYFVGVIEIEDETIGAKLTSSEGLLQPGSQFYVGRGKSRGLGLLEMAKIIEKYDSLSMDLESRLQKLNAAIQKKGFFPAEKVFFSITLETPAIIKDRFFRPRLLIAQLLKIPEDIIVEKKVSIANTEIISSWNCLQGLPRQDEVAITKGSSFLYEVKSTAGLDLVKELTKIEQEGIGCKRAEGYGRISICKEFHWEGIS